MIDLQPYFDILPKAILAFLIALLATPLIGNLANRFGFVDLPATLRKRTDNSLAQRIHEGAKPRLGGLAVLIPFLLISVSSLNMTTQLWGVMIGLTIIMVTGIIDDKYELSGRSQFLFQFLAAAVVVVTGTTISRVDIAGLNLDLVSVSSTFNLLGFTYNLLFPADLITILWIMTIINALNWVCGIDALGEGMTLIAAITTMISSVRSGLTELALLPALLGAGLLGFIPFNFPPSKIIAGTSGHTGYGYLIAVLSIINLSKTTTPLIILTLPLLDMAWVMLNRMREHKTINILRLLSVSGRVHLHHRLMSLGYSAKQTLYIEILFTIAISVVALFFGDFNSTLVAMGAVVSGLMIIFALISFRAKHKPTLREKKPDDPTPPPMIDGPTPEEKYAY